MSLEKYALLDLATAIETTREAGGLIHDMPPAVTAELTQYDLYTTKLAQDPGSLREFVPVYERDLALASIAERVATFLGSTEHYELEARKGILGTTIADDLRAVRTVNGVDIHMSPNAKASKKQKGVVMARKAELGVEGPETAQKVAAAIGGILNTRSTKMYSLVLPGVENKQGLTPVIIHNHSEHAARSLSRATQALMQGELLRKHGIRLPDIKAELAVWQEMGVTAPPHIAKRLREVREEYYNNVTLQGQYRNRPDLQAEKNRMIATDVAAVLELLRDLMNPLIALERPNEGHRQKT